MELQAMSFQIKKGLFNFDFTDEYAILGVTVNAEADEIRKQYLKIARLLHPDKFQGTPKEKQLASQLLSKLVNPAYEKLYSDKSRAEVKVILGHLGKRLGMEAAKIEISSPIAQKLLETSGNVDTAYKAAVQSLTSKQYEPLTQALDVIAQISEVNMVYLMLKGGEFSKKSAPAMGNMSTYTPPAPPTIIPIPKTDIPKPPPSPDKKAEDLKLKVEAYCRRADEYMDKKNFAKAVLELRDALQLDPNSSRSHSLMGMAYLQQNQATMAKIHINKALQLNPQEETAVKAKEMLDKLTGKPSTSAAKTTATSKQKPSGKPDDELGGTVIFGIRFGGKKK